MRSIHRTVTYFEESSAITNRGYTWKRVKRHKLWLECGHVVQLGGVAPTTKVKCPACEKGEARHV
jgi:hypothetical protein